jgi:hypothetical protein
MHFKISADFQLQNVDFASQHIADGIIRGAEVTRRRDIELFLGDSRHFGVFGALRGSLFEAMAHELLEIGGDFSVRELGPPAGEPVVSSLVYFPPSNMRWFRDLKDLAGLGSTDLCRPKTKTFAAVDALRRSGQLFQMTISAKKVVDAMLLEEVLQALDQNEEYKLFFVVPNNVLDKFKVTLPVVGKVEKPGSMARLRSVKYYALSIPVV